MNVGVGELLVIVAVLATLIVPLLLVVAAIVDLARRPKWQWAASGQNQIVWVLVVLIISCIGPIVYFIVARPKLEAVAGHGPDL